MRARRGFHLRADSTQLQYTGNAEAGSERKRQVEYAMAEMRDAADGRASPAEAATWHPSRPRIK
jgi:hypothetical protein